MDKIWQYQLDRHLTDPVGRVMVQKYKYVPSTIFTLANQFVHTPAYTSSLDPSLKNVPKCSILYANTLDTYSHSHPGFGLKFLNDQEQVAAGEIFIKRLVTFTLLYLV